MSSYNNHTAVQLGFVGSVHLLHFFRVEVSFWNRLRISYHSYLIRIQFNRTDESIYLKIEIDKKMDNSTNYF